MFFLKWFNNRKCAFIFVGYSSLYWFVLDVFGEASVVWNLLWFQHLSWPFGLCHLLRAANAAQDTCCCSALSNLLSSSLVFLLLALAIFDKYGSPETRVSVSHSSGRNLKHWTSFCSCVCLYYSHLLAVFYTLKKIMALKYHWEGH